MAQDEEDRYRAFLVSKLLQTPVTELEAFRRERLADHDVTTADLACLRACMRELARALDGNKAARWERVRAAAAALGTETPVDATAPGRAASPAQPLPFKSAPVTPRPRIELEPNASFGATAPMAPGAATSADLPFDGRTGPDAVVTVGLLSLTLEHHAALCAARTRSPTTWTEKLSAYGIADVALFDELDRAWHQRFEREPDLYKRWTSAFRRAHR